MKISSIDVGSNAIRQIIVDVDMDKYKKNPSSIHWETVKKYRAPIRLGTDVFSSKIISHDTLHALTLAFKQMADLHKKYKVSTVVCTATSALRDAKNQDIVVKHIKKHTGITIDVISGHSEAQLIKTAIAKSKVINTPKTLLIDIGGGSLELTSVIDGQIQASHSFPMGVVRIKQLLTEKNFNLDVYIQKHLKQYYAKSSLKNYDMAIGTGGNFDALSKLKLALLKRAPQTNLTFSEIKMIHRRWLKMSANQKLALPIRKDRIDVLGIALVLIEYIMKSYGIKNLKVPGTGLKEGLIYSILE